MEVELKNRELNQPNGKGAKTFVISFLVVTLFFIILTFYLIAPGIFTFNYF